jgi:hypothetical protein
MAKLTYCLTVVFISFISLTAFAQNQCKVLVPDLVGEYTGKCKKGFAHGKGKAVGKDTYEGNFKKGLPNGEGIYTWASGATYEGDWVFGVRTGEGIYKFKSNNNDSVQAGIWKENEYLGPKPERPKVIRKEFVTRYNFRRDGDGDRLLIDLKLNGSPNRDIQDFSIISSSGSYFVAGRSHGLETVIFPVTVKIKYLSWNAAHTSMHTATFEFEISEPGNWQVDIVN